MTLRTRQRAMDAAQDAASSIEETLEDLIHSGRWRPSGLRSVLVS